MNIVVIPALQDNYIWVIIDAKKPCAIIVDPGDAAPVFNFLQTQQLTLKAILITHHHWDHTDGIAELKKVYDVPVFAPAIDHVKTATIEVHDHDNIRIDDFPFVFKVMAIPGHTHGHVAYYVEGNLFCGDTLFAAGCGRLFEGTAAEMFSSLQKIAALPDETKIYCAHEYTLKNLQFAKIIESQNKKIDEQIKIVSEQRKNNFPSLPSTLKIEKATNPFLRVMEPAVKVFAENIANKSLADPVEIFKILREKKDWF